MRSSRIALLIVGVGLLSGCSVLGEYGTILRGNGLYRRGAYQEAAAAYLSVRGPRFKTLLSYDLANVYARLGETAAAVDLYGEARQSGEAELRAWSWYNEGLAHYEKGQYEEAYRAFREALAFDPTDEEARRNLELAYRDWKKESLAPPESASPASRREGARDEDEVRLLHRLETGRWRPGAREPSLPDPEDY